MKFLSRYRKLGVDVEKRGTESFQRAIEEISPGAFCVLQKDPSYPGMGLVLHTDSAGSKPIQAYLHYRETQDPSWFSGLAQDALAMNVNDVMCVGAKPISFVDYIALNTFHLNPSQVLESLADGFSNAIKTLEEEGLPLLFSGGETAELPDQMRTLDVCVALYGRAPLDNLITGEAITHGDLIIGLRSGGEIRYEESPNSGIMSNGLTLARNVLMKQEYVNLYPELAHSKEGRYQGRYSFDSYHEELGMSVGEALLSPTRLYAPIIKEVIKNGGTDVHGLVHNTGGGQTKCLRLGNNIHYIKDNLPEPDPIFRLIQKEGNIAWKEMYQDFNMGIGFDIIVPPELEDEVGSIINDYGMRPITVGRCERTKDGNKLTITTEKGEYKY